ncbi:hypothetical protein BpHYR1_047903 [Brachionus plicatilis]|uniref:Uncharacterized protein n=1 Tax=Brachionus plicatilis TaxID=10195 RepID=A0A3M7R5P7_BRAPC|nr:hypothetical protein BpHYR1_047903 [Brachionus plicatilis]
MDLQIEANRKKGPADTQISKDSRRGIELIEGRRRGITTFYIKKNKNRFICNAQLKKLKHWFSPNKHRNISVLAHYQCVVKGLVSQDTKMNKTNT